MQYPSYFSLKLQVKSNLKQVKELRRAYYAAVSYVDYNIGLLLDELSTLGLADNTIVVLWGDNGQQLGEHAEWDKKTRFEVASRVPLMVRVPGLTDSGVRSDRLTESVDIFPTLVEAAGFPPLDLCPVDSTDVELCREGDSLLPLVKNPTAANWKEVVFWQFASLDAKLKCS